MSCRKSLNDTASTIVHGSSSNLSQGVIYQSSLTQMASTSEKLEMRYSIMVWQYALTTDSYNFWVNLKKNTEQLGSIFDAKPSSINGNVLCVDNPLEPVIRYISITNVQQKGIFINNIQPPTSYFPAYSYNCEIDLNLIYCLGGNEVAQNLTLINATQISIDEIEKINTLLDCTGARNFCVDCTLRGL